MIAFDHDFFTLDRQAVEYFTEITSQFSRTDCFQTRSPENMILSDYMITALSHARGTVVMTEAAAVIVGAMVGAMAGLAGGGFAALASLRASQLAARAPLGPVLHEIRNTLTLVKTDAPKGTQEYWVPRIEFERRWNEFAIQQRILCPSERIARLGELVLLIGRNELVPPAVLLNLAGQTIEKITRCSAPMAIRSSDFGLAQKKPESYGAGSKVSKPSCSLSRSEQNFER
jgi:hypothetical protein